MQSNVERQSGTSADIDLSGDLTLARARELHELFSELAGRAELTQVRIDASDLGALDGAGAVTLRVGRSMIEEAGKACDLELRAEHEAIVRLLTTDAEEDEPERAGLLERTGEATLSALRGSAAFLTMVAQSLRLVARSGRRTRAGATIEQGVVIGSDAVPMVVLLGAMVGIVLGFQGQHQLRKFGAEIFMAELVGLGMVREFGALVTAIIVAGRSGAAISAELGTMKVNEEVDALHGMGIHPLAYLVLPRMAAITLAMPLLATLATAAGLAGGMGVAVLSDLPTSAVYERMQASLTLSDFALGFVKSLLFAWIVGAVSCFVGLRTEGGAHDVGQSTTRAVVASIVFIIVADSIVTTLWTVSNG